MWEGVKLLILPVAIECLTIGRRIAKGCGASCEINGTKCCRRSGFHDQPCFRGIPCTRWKAQRAHECMSQGTCTEDGCGVTVLSFRIIPLVRGSATLAHLQTRARTRMHTHTHTHMHKFPRLHSMFIWSRALSIVSGGIARWSTFVSLPDHGTRIREGAQLCTRLTESLFCSHGNGRYFPNYFRTSAYMESGHMTND